MSTTCSAIRILENGYLGLFGRSNESAHPHLIIVIKPRFNQNLVQDSQLLAILQIGAYLSTQCRLGFLCRIPKSGDDQLGTLGLVGLC